MTDRITPESLRSIANDKDGSPFWESWARQALLWAADTLEAAEKVIDERIPGRCEFIERPALDSPWMQCVLNHGHQGKHAL